MPDSDNKNSPKAAWRVLQARLKQATREQVAESAQLLALNLARYRKRIGVIPLDESPADVEKNAADAELVTEGYRILLEALGRIIGEEPPGLAKRPEKVRLVEQREYARIHVRIPIQVRNRSSRKPSAAKLFDLSWGGASFVATDPAGAAGDDIELSLPFKVGTKDISITASILRTWDLPDGQGVAVRFSSLTPEDDNRLEQVLLLLLEQHQGDRRKHPRVARRIEVEYGSLADWQGILENIGQGGMALTLPYPLKLSQSVQVYLSETSGYGSVTLRGRIVNIEPIQFGNKEIFQVSLRFQHPSDKLQDTVKTLLRSLAVTRTGKPGRTGSSWSREAASERPD